MSPGRGRIPVLDEQVVDRAGFFTVRGLDFGASREETFADSDPRSACDRSPPDRRDLATFAVPLTDVSIVLVLGAGGSDGGQFIDGALTQLRMSTGFWPAHADVIIGTSVGGFRAGSVKAAEPPSDTVITSLQALARPVQPARLPDRLGRRLRIAGGQLVIRLAPASRPAPAWDTPPGPYHPGACVVTVDVDRRDRAVHRLDQTADPRSAIHGSAAIPFAFGPVAIGPSRHADGAVWSPTSADLGANGPTGTTVEIMVVIAPMIPDSGGSLLDRLHRRQLRTELSQLAPETAVVVVRPEPGARRETRTSRAGAAAVRRLVSASD
jgi:predicted acylesterase/phospholipase RssA